MENPGVPAGRFLSAYDGVPPWDIGRPQPEFARALREGLVRGDVLDAGCGTGENALHLAAGGLEVVGIDVVPAAINKARAKAGERGLRVRFETRDALDLGSLGRRFDTIIDSGLFHVFSDSDRPRFTSSLRVALRPGGSYLLLCFSDREPGNEGPRRVAQKEIQAAFGDPWRIDFIREARFETRVHAGGAAAWFASVTLAAEAGGPPGPRSGGWLPRLWKAMRRGSPRNVGRARAEERRTRRILRSPPGTTRSRRRRSSCSSSIPLTGLAVVSP